MGPWASTSALGQGCLIGIQLLVRHVVHLQQLPASDAALSPGRADDADDDLAMNDHSPDLVAFEGLHIWDGGNSAMHAMTDRFVIHNRP